MTEHAEFHALDSLAGFLEQKKKMDANEASQNKLLRFLVNVNLLLQNVNDVIE